MSDSKIQVKVGIIEFSGEGNQDWLSKQLDKILDKVPELLKIEASDLKDGKVNGGADSGGKTLSGLSVLNIVGRLSAKSGAEVAIAAGAYLHFVKAQPVFSRDDLSSTMKRATGIYKNSMLGNLTTILAQLEKNGTFTKSSSSYSLNAEKVSELNAILSK